MRKGGFQRSWHPGVWDSFGTGSLVRGGLGNGAWCCRVRVSIPGESALKFFDAFQKFKWFCFTLLLWFHIFSVYFSTFRQESPRRFYHSSQWSPRDCYLLLSYLCYHSAFACRVGRNTPQMSHLPLARSSRTACSHLWLLLPYSW